MNPKSSTSEQDLFKRQQTNNSDAFRCFMRTIMHQTGIQHLLTPQKQIRHKNHLRSVCQNAPVTPPPALRLCARECVALEVGCHAERMMKWLSAWWNTSAAPFSHALCLFKVTSEKGICIGKRNSECKEAPRPTAARRDLRGRDDKKLVSYTGTRTTEAITHIFFHCLAPGGRSTSGGGGLGSAG